MSIGSLAFLSPWILAALFALPALWWLLRAVPPAPIRQRFPAVALLLGLQDKQTTPDRTPWWLLLLRMLAVAAGIFAFAQPVLNPVVRVAGSGPLLVAMDATWASAQNWDARKDKLKSIVNEAAQDGRPVSVIKWSDAPKSDFASSFTGAQDWIARLQSFAPNAWEPDYESWVAEIAKAEFSDVVWFSDGLDHLGRSALFAALSKQGDVSIIQGSTDVVGVKPVSIADGMLSTKVMRDNGALARVVSVSAIGPDPSGIPRRLSTVDVEFSIDETMIDVNFDLPTELRNRVRQVSIDGVTSAGAVTITDDAIQRRKVALITASANQEANDLLSPLHFLRKALVDTAETIEANLADSLVANPDIVVLADFGKLSETENVAVAEWVAKGGTLLRFAGPRLIASGIGQKEEHPLLPVRLRSGGRSVGGAMSWGAPRKLRNFPEDSPFFGLTISDDVTVSSQVVAQPDPDLANRVLATLEDGTPLVTAKQLGEGRVVLFHVTANTKWSSLPLSGLFVQMLERLAISAKKSPLDGADLAGLTWIPKEYIDAFGLLRDATSLNGVKGEDLVTGITGPGLRPGIYANADRRVALNVISGERELISASWPVSTSILSLQRSDERPLQAMFLIAALGLLLLDIIATLFLNGRLIVAKGITQVAVIAFAICLIQMAPVTAQNLSDGDKAILAANNTVLAYVITGDDKLDEISKAGLTGLSAELYRRTSIEPIPPVGVTLGQDELSLYPFLYWPMSEGQRRLPDDVAAVVNNYLRGGGFIMFDTRDAHIAGSIGGATPNGRKLQQIAAGLDIPRIAPIPSDHVLTRTFYLLESFPGRYVADVWGEASPDDAKQVEGLPFRTLNDGVTPVLIGSSDWAGAWAIDERGRHLFPVGRGITGQRQREYAIRFGINVLMYVMTGNYKSDQVHVPALLDRLGQ